MLDSAFVSLERLPYDGSEWHIKMSASNGYFSGVQNFYTYSEDLEILGTKFCRFGQNLQDEVLLRLGERSDKYAFFLLVRAFLSDSVGHAAIEFAVDNNQNSPNHAQARFFIHTEVAAINNLGQQIRAWVVSSNSLLLWLPKITENF